MIGLGIRQLNYCIEGSFVSLIYLSIGQLLHSWATWSWESFHRNVQRQSGQAMEVHVFNC